MMLRACWVTLQTLLVYYGNTYRAFFFKQYPFPWCLQCHPACRFTCTSVRGGEYVCPCTCEDVRGGCSHSLPTSLETSALTQPEARPAASKPCDSLVSAPHSSGAAVVYVHAWLFTWVLGSKLQCKRLHSRWATLTHYAISCTRSMLLLGLSTLSLFTCMTFIFF